MYRRGGTYTGVSPSSTALEAVLYRFLILYFTSVMTSRLKHVRRLYDFQENADVSYGLVHQKRAGLFPTCHHPAFLSEISSEIKP